MTKNELVATQDITQYYEESTQIVDRMFENLQRMTRDIFTDLAHNLSKVQEDGFSLEPQL